MTLVSPAVATLQFQEVQTFQVFAQGVTDQGRAALANLTGCTIRGAKQLVIQAHLDRVHRKCRPAAYRFGGITHIPTMPTVMHTSATISVYPTTSPNRSPVTARMGIAQNGWIRFVLASPYM